AAFGDVGIAEPELKPLDPGNVPDDVEISLTDLWESDAGRRVDRVPALGVAHQHGKPRNADTGKQGAWAEIVSSSHAPRFLARLIKIVLLKREVAGRVAVGRLQRRAVSGRAEASAHPEPPPDENPSGIDVPSREVAKERRAHAALVRVLEPDLEGQV